MTPEEVLTHVTEIFKTVLKKEQLHLTPATTAADVDGWDSLTHVMLIDAVENHYKIKFKLNEVIKFNNIGDLCACILKKLPA
jgi:acyl carrier protein